MMLFLELIKDGLLLVIITNAADDTLVGAVSNSSLSNLFDGDYESTMSIPAGQYAIVNVNFSTESGGLYPGYPYGDFYLSSL